MTAIKIPTAEEYNIRPGEAALLIRVHVATLRKWRVRKTGPTYLKIGRAVWYSRQALEAWLKSRVY